LFSQRGAESFFFSREGRRVFFSRRAGDGAFLREDGGEPFLRIVGGSHFVQGGWEVGSILFREAGSEPFGQRRVGSGGICGEC
jgi:hypothetical protein